MRTLVREENHVIGGPKSTFQSATYECFVSVMAELQEQAADVGRVFELSFADLNRHEGDDGTRNRSGRQSTKP